MSEIMPSRFQSLVSTEVGGSRWFETSQADAVALAAVLDAHCRERLANYEGAQVDPRPR